MRRFGVRADGEDASARAWVVAWTPASAKSASARTPTSLRGVSHVHVRTFRKQVSDAGRRVSWSRRVRGPRFRGRRGRARARVVPPPSVARRGSGNTKTPRARRCVRKRASSMRRRVVSRRRHAPSEDRVCGRDAPRRAPVRGFHVYAIETIRGVLVRGASLAHHRRPEARARVFLPTFHFMFNSTSELRNKPGQLATWSTPVSVKCCHVRRSLLQPASSLPLAPRVLGTPLVVNMNPAMIARNPVVVATAARPRVAARRASAAAVRQADGLVSRASVGSARRATRCAASESEADKTVSALDAILAGSQDEPAPEEVRWRASPRLNARTRAFSVSRHTPSADTGVLRLAFSSSRSRWRFCVSKAFWKAALLESRGFRGRRASLRNYARLTPSGLLSFNKPTGAPRAGGAEGTQARRGERRDEGEDAQRVRRRRRHAQQAHARELVPEHHPGHIRARGALQTRGHLRLRSAESARDARREPNDDDDD